VFDARPDRTDFRDLPYRPPLRSLPPRFPEAPAMRRFVASYVHQGLILNQGSEGACTGFGLAGVVNHLLWVRHLAAGGGARFAPVSPRMLYEMARRYDEWPGTDYDGSSCRGALKGWHKHGVCSAAHWPYEIDRQGAAVFVRPKAGWDVDAVRRPLGVYYRVPRESVVDLQAAIVDIGAVYVSASVHDGWDALSDRDAPPPRDHGAIPTIPPPQHPRRLGGHAFALVGFDERGFIVQNSWGVGWGASGFAVLPYDDWVIHGTDAWACALGVPVSLPATGHASGPRTASRWRVASGRSLATLERDARAPGNPADDPWPVDHEFLTPAYRPWSTDAAYRHTLVTGNDGVLVVTDFTRASSDAAGLAQEIVCEAPLQWFDGQLPSKVARLAIYAHGGLNAEAESIARIRVLAPYFEANGIYPLFLTWKTGAGEILRDMAQDWARELVGEGVAVTGGLLDALGDARDRAVEAIAHVLATGVWSEMRENAARAADSGHGLDLLATQLVALRRGLKARGRRLEVHLVGHSAGSILLGHLLDRLADPGRRAASLEVQSCTLYAAACSVRFAVDHYLGAADRGVLPLDRLWLAVLSDANEKDDALPRPDFPVYGKSLLYLVSRALDDARKQPLLGMERALDAAYANDAEQWSADELASLKTWQRRGPGLVPPPRANAVRVVRSPQVRNTRAGGQVAATHGSFDNHIELLTETIERIRGAPLIGELEWLDF